MTNKVLAQRKKQFDAWTKALSGRKGRRKNPFHDSSDYKRSKTNRRESMNLLVEHYQLKKELEAWEAASDEDFETFEEALG